MYNNVMRLFYNKTTIQILAAGMALIILAMIPSGRRLKTPTTPGGILCLEFANTAQKVESVLTAWETGSIGKGSAIDAAKSNTYLDYIFLFLYSLFLFTSCLQLAASLPGKKTFSFIFKLAAVFALMAGVLDILENAGMLNSLNGAISDKEAMATATYAAIKWILVIGVILAIAGGLIYRQFIKSGKV